MFRSKILWGSILGVLTAVLIFEIRTSLGYNTLWNRVLGVFTVPGARFANAIFASGVPHWIWANLWSMLTVAGNVIVYALFWSLCIWIASYFRERGHPYDRQGTLVPPSLATHTTIKAEPGPFDLRYYE